MNYRRLGKTGLKVSELSYGSWVTFSFQVGLDEAVNIMELAYENGVNFFDNAEAYASGESEIIMGKALKKLGWSRDSFIISPLTKLLLPFFKFEILLPAITVLLFSLDDIMSLSRVVIIHDESTKGSGLNLWFK